MTELIDAVVSPRALIVALLLFGLAPGLVLRAIVLAYPRDDVRRKELVGELYAVPRHERPFWVFEQLERALFEGLPVRYGRWKDAGHDTSTIEGSADAAVSVHGHARGRVMTEDVTFAPTAVFEPAVVKIQPASMTVAAAVVEPPVVKVALPAEGDGAASRSI